MNVFDKGVLELHQANMGIQFMANYIPKTIFGTSRILRDVMDEIKTGNCLHHSSSFSGAFWVACQIIRRNCLTRFIRLSIWFQSIGVTCDKIWPQNLHCMFGLRCIQFILLEN